LTHGDRVRETKGRVTRPKTFCVVNINPRKQNIWGSKKPKRLNLKGRTLRGQRKAGKPTFKERPLGGTSP